MLCKWSHMMVGAKGCEFTDGFLWFVCGLYVGILTSPLILVIFCIASCNCIPNIVKRIVSSSPKTLFLLCSCCLPSHKQAKIHPRQIN